MRRTRPKPDAAGFAAALRQARESNGISQKTLGQLVGLSEGRISQFESGQVPDPQHVFELEDGLFLPPGELSWHLGYVPVGTESVLAAIDASTDLDRRSKELLADLYHGELRRRRSR